MKTAFLLFVLTTTFAVFSQEVKKSQTLEVGAMFFQKHGKSITYSLGYSRLGKKENTKWSNEFFFINNKYNDFEGIGITVNFDCMSYGKAYNFHLGNFLIKPSLNSGVYYWDFRGSNGFQYNLGLNINPRLQVGWEFPKVRVSVVSSLTYGWSWFKYIKSDGTNPNSGIFFPIDYNPRWLTVAAVAFKI